MSRSNLLIITFFCLFTSSLFSQIPFICQDNFYLSLAENSQLPSQFYEVILDQNGTTTTVAFDPFQDVADYLINGIGYRKKDNLIYGVRHKSYEIHQVDATGQSILMGEITGVIDSFGTFIAGDISRDGKNLILIGRLSSFDRNLILVDLDSPTYAATSIDLTLSSNGLPSNVKCSDIAIDPIDNSIYGFDRFSLKLVRIDVNTGIVYDDIFPSYPDNPEVLGAMFFDSFGNLFAYGQPLGADAQNTFYKVDKTTGAITPQGEGPIAKGNDGCSCPYTVSMIKEVFPTQTYPCEEVEYTFTISNLSGEIQEGIEFNDFFPIGITVTEILQNPFGGNITSGFGTDNLIIENMTLPEGKHQLIVKALVDETANGILNNQAEVFNLPQDIGGSKLSDNPNTIEPNDATPLVVLAPLVQATLIDTVYICPNESAFLMPDSTASSYEWYDESNAPIKEVYTLGEYSVKVEFGCQFYFHTFHVEPIILQIETIEQVEIELGESATLSPFIFSSSPYSISWTTTSESDTISCSNCSSITVQPLFDTEYQISVINEQGCKSIVTISVIVKKPRNIYIPSGFSPNDDGFNDQFFIQSKFDQKIKYFRIFDRWGELIFEKNNFYTNDSTLGWNGLFLNKNLNTGVFVYQIQVEFLDGEIIDYQGDVTLVK